VKFLIKATFLIKAGARKRAHKKILRVNMFIRAAVAREACASRVEFLFPLSLFLFPRVLP